MAIVLARRAEAGLERKGGYGPDCAGPGLGWWKRARLVKVSVALCQDLCLFHEMGCQ